jgi:predicted phosphodiesterase
MRFLILSDLHIGTKARAKELCPYPEGLHKDNALVSLFITKAKEYQSSKGDFDYLIIPGDVTNQSNLVEYDCGSKFLEKILKELSIDRSKIIFVPGNHDIDWSVLEGKTIYPEEKPLRRSHKYNTLKDDKHVFSSLASPELVSEPFIKKWEFADVVFFGFNSAWHDDSIEEKHYGLIQKEQIDKLRELFNNTDLNKLKFFVVHHHLHQFENPHRDWRDISIMQNAQPLLELLTEFEFDFVIHGHRHVPNFLSININHSKVINVLCAGSYCCEVPASIAGHIGNLFHVVEIDDPKECKGKIYSFAYNPREGWVESREHDGIAYENPFGSQITFDDMLKQCTKELQAAFAAGKYVLCSELKVKIPDLNYLQLSQQKKLFGQLEKDCNAKKTIDTEKEVLFIKKQ